MRQVHAVRCAVDSERSFPGDAMITFRENGAENAAPDLYLKPIKLK
jgi:hypothetical protein